MCCLLLVLTPPLRSESSTHARLAALPIYAAATAKRFGLYEPIDLSTDGTKVAYTSCEDRRHTTAGTRSGGKSYWGAVGCGIDVSSARDGATTTVVSSGDSGFPAWSPDGRLLAYVSDRSGENQLYIWDSQTKASRRVLTAPMHASSQPVWFKDGRTILVSVASRSSGKTQEAEATSSVITSGPLIKGAAVTVYRSAENLSARESAQAKRASLAPPYSLAQMSGDLATVDVFTGAVRVLLPGSAIRTCVIAPNGLYAGCGSTVGFSTAKGATVLTDIIVVNLSTLQVRTVARGSYIPYLTG